MEGTLLPGTLRVFLTYTSGFLFFLHPEGVANLSCGTEQETSVQVLRECKALASFRHAYLGSVFLDPEDVTNLNIVTIWNFGTGTGLL
jgi:hypothetical protein